MKIFKNNDVKETYPPRAKVIISLGFVICKWTDILIILRFYYFFFGYVLAEGYPSAKTYKNCSLLNYL